MEWPRRVPPGPGLAAPAQDLLAKAAHSAHTARFELVVGWSLASVPDAFYFPDWSI